MLPGEPKVRGHHRFMALVTSTNARHFIQDGVGRFVIRTRPATPETNPGPAYRRVGINLFGCGGEDPQQLILRRNEFCFFFSNRHPRRCRTVVTFAMFAAPEQDGKNTGDLISCPVTAIRQFIK